MNAPSLGAQTLVDVRGHGEEHLLHVLRALGAGLQEGDFQGGGQILGGEEAGLSSFNDCVLNLETFLLS